MKNHLNTRGKKIGAGVAALLAIGAVSATFAPKDAEAPVTAVEVVESAPPTEAPTTTASTTTTTDAPATTPGPTISDEDLDDEIARLSAEIAWGTTPLSDRADICELREIAGDEIVADLLESGMTESSPAEKRRLSDAFLDLMSEEC